MQSLSIKSKIKHLLYYSKDVSEFYVNPIRKYNYLIKHLFHDFLYINIIHATASQTLLLPLYLEAGLETLPKNKMLLLRLSLMKKIKGVLKTSLRGSSALSRLNTTAVAAAALLPFSVTYNGAVSGSGYKATRYVSCTVLSLMSELVGYLNLWFI